MSEMENGDGRSGEDAGRFGRGTRLVEQTDGRTAQRWIDGHRDDVSRDYLNIASRAEPALQVRYNTTPLR